MGIFKKKQKDYSVSNETKNMVFGDVRNIGNWYTVNSFPITIWENSFSVRVRLVSNGKEDPITNEQEEAFKRFQANQKEYERLIEDGMDHFFCTVDAEKLHGSIDIQGLYIGKDGKLGAALCAHLNNDLLEENGIGPDDQFGIVLYPEMHVLPSNEEFLDYFE